jgi:hypothetical protein
MYGEARKLHLIEAILKIKNDAVLTAVETAIAKNNLQLKPRKSFKKFAGGLTDEEANEFEKVINEACETINKDDWK